MYRNLKRSTDYYRSTDNGVFWVNHQRFFAALLVSMGLPVLDELTTTYPQTKWSYIISLTCTGESALRRDHNFLPLYKKPSLTRSILKHALELIGIQISYTSSQDAESDDESSEGDEGKRKKSRLNIQDYDSASNDVDANGSESCINDSNDGQVYSESFETSIESEVDSIHQLESTTLEMEENNEIESDESECEEEPVSTKKRKRLANDWRDFCTVGDIRIRREKSCIIDSTTLQEVVDLYLDLENLLPETPIEFIKEKFGGPLKVAEITGRRCQVIDGTPTKRSIDCIKEQERFQNEECSIVLISDKGSTGINLHAEVTAANPSPKPRVHICIELPWSAEKATQGFGRSHRSGEILPPHYKVVTTDVPGHLRFAVSVIDRLSKLAAITKGDRHASDGIDLNTVLGSDSSIANNACQLVFEQFLSMMHESDMKEFSHELLAVGLLVDKKGKIMVGSNAKVLISVYNRLMGIKIETQEYFHRLITSSIKFQLEVAQANGTFDYGLKKLGSLWRLSSDPNQDQIYTLKNGTVVLWKVVVDRGMSWKQIQEKARLAQNAQYFVQQDNSKEIMCIIPALMPEDFYLNTPYNIEQRVINRQKIQHEGWVPCTMTESQLSTQWKATFTETAKLNMCIHKMIDSKSSPCLGKDCNVGVRGYVQYVLVGSVITVWKELTDFLETCPHATAMKVKRGESMINQVGVLIPRNLVPNFEKVLEERVKRDKVEIEYDDDSEESDVENQNEDQETDDQVDDDDNNEDDDNQVDNNEDNQVDD